MEARTRFNKLVKDSGAYGTFTVTHDISKTTRAKGREETELFARLTTVAGERGALDAERTFGALP